MKKTIIIVSLLFFLLTACENAEVQELQSETSTPPVITESAEIQASSEDLALTATTESHRVLESSIEYALAFDPTAAEVFLHSDAVILATVLERHPPSNFKSAGGWFTPYTVEVVEVISGEVPDEKITVNMTGAEITPVMMAEQMDENILRKMKIDLSKMTAEEQKEIFLTETERSIDLETGEKMVFGLNKGIVSPGWFLATPGYAAYRIDENRQLEDRYEEKVLSLDSVLEDVKLKKQP